MRGDGYDKQLKVLESGVDILIGTTGRLIDYAKQNHINLGAIQVVVLDEADRMYDLGFIKDIRWLFRRMPPANQRLNMLFSATLSYRVRELAFEQMNNAEYVEVEPEQKTGHRIKEELFYPSNEEKMRLLQTLLEEEWPDRAIIFANTKHRCEDIWGHLAADGHRVGLLTGDVAQKNACAFSMNLPAAISTFWSQPTLPPAVCIFRPLRTSLTTTCRTIAKTTFTVLAVPAALAPAVTPSAWPVKSTR